MNDDLDVLGFLGAVALGVVASVVLVGSMWVAWQLILAFLGLFG